MSEEQAVRVVTVLLSTLFELHRQGVCHGDFYAHNILVNANDYSQVRLTDWGAAFQYDRNEPHGRWIESTELRAFAVFLQEILDHAILPCAGSQGEQEDGEAAEREQRSSDSSSTVQVLTELQKICREAVENGQGFESPLIWWKQRRLQDLARKLDDELDI
jgi:serine/threonine protein kinase